MNEIDRLSIAPQNNVKHLTALKQYPQAYQIIIDETAKTHIPDENGLPQPLALTKQQAMSLPLLKPTRN